MERASSATAVLHEIWQRFTSRWWLKTLGYSVYLSAFMALYFTLLRHPLFPVRTMPLTALDQWIGFAPWSLLLYASLWFYISLVPSLCRVWEEMRVYLIQVTVLSGVGFAVFLFWPTAVPAPDIDWSQHPSVQFLKTVDAAGNACPSLHVAFAVLTAVWLNRMFRHFGAPLWLLALNILWCLGILYSTLATKQHVALDLYAGAILGYAITWLPPRPYLSPLQPPG